MGSSGEHPSGDLHRKLPGFHWIAKLFVTNENDVAVRKFTFWCLRLEKAGTAWNSIQPQVSPSLHLMKLMKEATSQSAIIPRSGFKHNVDDAPSRCLRANLEFVP